MTQRVEGKFRVLVCGSRTFSDRRVVDAILDGFASREGIVTLIEGGASGADFFAAEWAEALASVGWYRFAADWETHGKAAGPIRNKRMLEEGRPHLVLAFVDKPLVESKGTADMVRRAHDAGVPVYVIRALGEPDGR